MILRLYIILLSNYSFMINHDIGNGNFMDEMLIVNDRRENDSLYRIKMDSV